MNSKIKKVLLFAFFSRLIILFLPWLTNTLILPENTHLNFIEFTQTSWNRWDAPHYLYLATNGYTNVGDEANFIVFFPLYPLLLKPLILLIGHPALTGMLASTIFYILGCYFLYKLVSFDYSEKIASWTVVAISIFPTSFFFNSPYTESLFLLTFCMSLYAARKNQWGLAGIASGLATITRPFGFLILAAVLIEWVYDKKRQINNLPFIVIPTIISGISYLYINYLVFENPFKFQEILATNWQKHFTSPLVGILDSWNIAFTSGLTNFGLFVGWGEALTITASWLLVPFVFKYLRRSWAVFYILSLIMFSSTSFILSTPRYLLSIPTFFVLIAMAQKNYLFRMIWTFFSIGLLFCLCTIFTAGQWAF